MGRRKGLDTNGYAIEIRLTRYEVKDGKTERENHASHYCGSLTRAQANRVYEACDRIVNQHIGRGATGAPTP